MWVTEVWWEAILLHRLHGPTNVEDKDWVTSLKRDDLDLGVCLSPTSVSLLLTAEPVHLAMTLSMHFLWMAALHSKKQADSLVKCGEMRQSELFLPVGELRLTSALVALLVETPKVRKERKWWVAEGVSGQFGGKVYVCVCSYQTNSLQTEQKVGCGKKVALNSWHLTTCTLACLMAPRRWCSANRPSLSRSCSPSPSTRPSAVSGWTSRGSAAKSAYHYCFDRRHLLLILVNFVFVCRLMSADQPCGRPAVWCAPPVTPTETHHSAPGSTWPPSAGGPEASSPAATQETRTRFWTRATLVSAPSFIYLFF